MINLLSREEQKKVYREYLLRIATLVFLSIGVIGTVFILILIPSYMRLQSEIALVHTELARKKAQMTPEDQTQIAEAQRFLTEIRVLQGASATSSMATRIERVILLKPAKVSLLGVQYDVTEGKEPKFDIKGKADRREDLLEFKSRLETEAGFSQIDIPSQTLIKRTDIQFSMSLSTPGAPSVSTPTVEDTSDLLPLP